MTNLTTTTDVTFDGEPVEDLEQHVFHNGRRVHVAECYGAPGFITAATVINWLTDDNGNHHFLVSDTTGGFEYADNVNTAWETAVEFTCNVADQEYPVDLAFDERIPAHAHGDRSELEVRYGLPKR